MDEQTVKRGYIITITSWINNLYLQQPPIDSQYRNDPLLVLLAIGGIVLSLFLGMLSGEQGQWVLAFLFVLLGSFSIAALVQLMNSTPNARQERYNRKKNDPVLVSKQKRCRQFLESLSCAELLPLLTFCNMHTNSVCGIVDLSEEIEVLKELPQYTDWEFLDELPDLLSDALSAKQIKRERDEAPAEL